MKQLKQGFFFRNNRWQLSKGQSLLEFALVIPLFLLLLFGIFEFGRYLTAIITINTASREGARYGAGIGNSNAGVPYYRDCTGITSAATRFGMFAGIDTVEIHYDQGPGSYTDWDTLPSCSSTIKVGLADRIGVRVTGEYTPAILFTDMTIPLESISFRTLVTKLDVRSTEYPVEDEEGEEEEEEEEEVDPCTLVSMSNVTSLGGGVYTADITNNNPATRAVFKEIYVGHQKSSTTKYFSSLTFLDVISTPVTMYTRTFAAVKNVTNFTFLPINELAEYPTGTQLGVEPMGKVQIRFAFSNASMSWNVVRVEFNNFTCLLTDYP